MDIMDFSRICHVLCHLILWTTRSSSKSLPDSNGNFTSNETTTDLQKFVNNTKEYSTASGNYSSEYHHKSNVSDDYQTQTKTTAPIYMYDTSSAARKLSEKDGTHLLQTTQRHLTEQEKTTVSTNEDTIHTTQIVQENKGNEITENYKAVTPDGSEKSNFDMLSNKSLESNLSVPYNENATETSSTNFSASFHTSTASNGDKYNKSKINNNDKNVVDLDTTKHFNDKQSQTTAASFSTMAAIPEDTTTYHPHHRFFQKAWLGDKHGRPHLGSMHHLSLVPIEDGPFGSLIWRDKKYLVTVLVPIGIGIVGAACIIGMAYVVRFCHRNERKMQEIRENIQKRLTMQNDQVILLANSSDEEF